MTVPYKINDAVLLSRQREGIIRYIGNVHFNHGIWCGIELIGGSVGTNDGKFEGHRYFTCPRNRGLFCKIGKVRRKFREKDHSAQHRQKRKASLEQRLYHRSLADTAVQSEIRIKNISKNPKENRYRSKSAHPKHKSKNKFELSNVEIKDKRQSRPRNSRKMRSQTKPTTSKVNWLTERLRGKKSSRNSTSKPYKPGPRDIGRVSGNNWKPIDYTEKDTQSSKPSWMRERLSSPTTIAQKRKRSKSSDPKPFKPGPRDIGKVQSSSWRGIKLSKAEKQKLNSGAFLQERGRAKTHDSPRTKAKICKAGPRDVGRVKNGWKPIQLSAETEQRLNKGSFLDDRINGKRKRSKSAKPNGSKGKAEVKSKKFKIAVDGQEVSDIKQLTKTRAENKQLMKGGKGKGKGKSKQKRNRSQPRQKIYRKNGVKKSKNENMFDSFRRNTKRNKRKKSGFEDTQRASVRVQLNQGNMAKKSKNNPNNYVKGKKGKKRQSAHMGSNGYSINDSEIVSNAKYTPYNAVKYMPTNNQRASAYNTTNYTQFAPYNPNDTTQRASDKPKPMRKHISAANESEADFDLGEDDIDMGMGIDTANDILFDEDIKHNIDHTSDHKPNTHVADLFGVDNDTKDEIWTPKASEPTTPVHYDSPGSDNGNMTDGSMSPSGHAHIYEGNDSLFDIFDEYGNVNNKPLPAPPNKPLPKVNLSRKGRIKGIDKYVGKWTVTFKELKPVFSAVNKRRSSSVASKKYRRQTQESVNAFVYSIYKDGSVQIQPKESFGWDGSANIIFDEMHQRFEIHSSNGGEYEYILTNRNGTLNIQHFSAMNSYKIPFVGTGVKG